jgi:peptidoglycan biosynthesis protein MviN/MurJ (putative lipid II flippase)
MKVFLSPSNQKSNTWAVGKTNEKEQATLFADKVQVLLEKQGVEVVRADGAVIAKRINYAKDCDLYIPLHTNAYNKNVRGCRLYVYKKNKEECSEFVTKGTRILLLLAVPCSVGVALVAKDLVQVVFGELFMPSVLCLQIMTPVIVIMGIGDLLCYQTIISSENEKLLVVSRIFAGVISIILNLLLIPRWQHNGAAIATLVCELAVNGILLPKALSIASVKLNAKFVMSIIASTVVMAVVVLAIQQLSSHALVALVLAVLGGIVAYVAMAVLTKNELIAYVIDVLKQKTKKK